MSAPSPSPSPGSERAQVRRFRLASPAGLVLAGAVLLLAFAACELAGFRTSVSCLSGTDPVGVNPTRALAQAYVYVAAWLGAVVLAPALLVASALFALLLLVGRRATRPKGDNPGRTLMS